MSGGCILCGGDAVGPAPPPFSLRTVTAHYGIAGGENQVSVKSLTVNY